MCCIGLTETREVAGRRLRKSCRQEERVGGQARLLDAARRSHRMRTFLQPTARCFWGDSSGFVCARRADGPSAPAKSAPSANDTARCPRPAAS